MGLPRTRQPLSLGALAISTLCHGLLFVILLKASPLHGLRFYRELVGIAGIVTACSLGAFFSQAPSLFAVIHALHGISLFAAAQILGGAFLSCSLLFSLPFFVESALYLEEGVAVGASIAAATLVAGGDALRYRAVPTPGRLDDLLAYVTVSGVTIFLLTAVLRNRERIVARDERIQALDSAVNSLSNANRAFQIYADSIEAQSAEEERKRITRELHDTVGYALTSIIMTINAEKVLLGEVRPDASELLDSMRLQAEQTLEETRRILYRLRAIPTGAPAGLAAIEHLMRTFQSATGVVVELRRGNYPHTCGSAIDEVILRFIQEGLLNAFRHGKATRVTVNLWQRERELSVSIWDNGSGSAAIAEGIGLQGMRERFGSLGGHVDPHDAPDGFEIVGVIPIARSAIDA